MKKYNLDFESKSTFSMHTVHSVYASLCMFLLCIHNPLAWCSLQASHCLEDMSDKWELYWLSRRN